MIRSAPSSSSTMPLPHGLLSSRCAGPDRPGHELPDGGGAALCGETLVEIPQMRGLQPRQNQCKPAAYCSNTAKEAARSFTTVTGVSSTTSAEQKQGFTPFLPHHKHLLRAMAPLQIAIEQLGALLKIERGEAAVPAAARG